MFDWHIKVNHFLPTHSRDEDVGQTVSAVAIAKRSQMNSGEAECPRELSAGK